MLTGKIYCPEAEYHLIQPKPILNLWLFSFSVVLILCLFISTGFCQQKGVYKPGDVLFENPLEKFNLPNMQANNLIFQDSKGFMWLGHQDGLYRYDGYELKEFTETPIGKDDLSATQIGIMAEDEFGYIWIGCYRKGGLFRYDPRTEIFTRFPRPGKDPDKLDDAEIWSLLSDNVGNIWVGTSGYAPPLGRGLYRYNNKSDSFKIFLPDTNNIFSIPSLEINASYIDKYNNLWFGTLKGLTLFDPENERFSLFELQNKDGINIPLITLGIKEDKLGNLWLNNYFYPYTDSVKMCLVRISDKRNQLDSKLSGQKKYFKDYKDYLIKDIGFFMDLDQNGNLWLNANSKGINRFDPDKETWHLFEPGYQSKYGLSSAPFANSDVFCDASGQMWFGLGNGFQKYSTTKQKFTLYDHDFFGLPEHNGTSINSVYEDVNGNLWIAYDEGLFKYNSESRKLSVFKPSNLSNPEDLKFPENLDNLIVKILPVDDRTLYCAGRSAFYIFDMQKETFTQIPYWITRVGQNYKIWPFSMIQDRNGMIWIGANGGFFRFDPDSKKKEFVPEIKGFQNFNAGIVFALCIDKRDRIWIGTEFGLQIYSPGADSLISVNHDSNKPEGLAAPQISTILQDATGNMWLGTRSNGISYLDASYIDEEYLDPDSLKFKHFSKRDGLPDLHIRGLIEDNDGNIWVANFRGIAKIDILSKDITTFFKDDGIQIDNFIRSFTKNPLTGRIYLGGITGLISFHPDSIPINTFVPPIVLTDFKLNNQSIPISDTTPLKQSISYTDYIDLSYKDNFLEIEFAALDFTYPEGNQYKYRMLGIDPDTVFSGTKRTAEYRDIKPGEYTFWVTGSNNDGIWNPDGISLSINIHPPWYGSKIAYAGYGLTVILLLLGILRWRTNSLRKERETLIREVESRTLELKSKNEKIQELDQLKTRFFTDISHEIRTPLSLILGPIDNLMNEHGESYRKKEWLELIKRNGKRLMHLIDQLLDITRLDEGKMRLIMIEENITQYLRVLINEFQSMAEAKNIKYVVDIPEKEYVTWYDRDKLTKIVTNLITNAIKFTPEREIVTCRIKIPRRKLPSKSDYLKIIIADTGIGISNDNLNNIFTRFYRGREAIQESARGTGIGLSLVKELVEILHGKVRVKSRPKTGTIFIVEIPLGLDHLKKDEFVFKEVKPDIEVDEIKAESAELMNGENNFDEAHGKYEILIIEDNLDLREFIKEVLTPTYNILETENGDEGLNLAFEKIPDLILTDIMMPGIDGIELCNRIKQDERTSHIPVIMLTARSTSEQKVEGLETGADDYITKPFKIEELNSRIQNLLEQRDKLRKKFSSLIGFDFDDIEINSRDEKYLKKITGIIDENMGDFEFDVGRLQEELGISRVHLYRKLKALTGMSTSELIRVMRLKMASKLLQQNNRNITTIAFKVGFSSPSYFAKCFKEHFGISPKEYSKKSST